MSVSDDAIDMSKQPGSWNSLDKPPRSISNDDWREYMAEVTNLRRDLNDARSQLAKVRDELAASQEKEAIATAHVALRDQTIRVLRDALQREQ